MNKKKATFPPSELKIKSYGMLDIFNPLGFGKIVLRHNTEASNELFSLLEYYSEIDNVGDKWLKSRYPNNLKRKSVYLTLQSFIRQAKSYYYAAEGQGFSIAPLSYFYSFENLVKAYLTVKRGNTYKQKDYHGLNYHPEKDGRVYLIKSGVFSDFYRESMKTTISSKISLDIIKQLSYCRDISYEYSRLHNEAPAYISGKSAFVVTDPDKLAHVVLAVNPPLRMVTNNLFKERLNKYYNNAVTFNNLQKLNILGIPLNENHLYSYHISKEGWDSGGASFPLDVSENANKVFPTNFFPNLLSKEEQFVAFMPLRANRVIEYNEIMAIYVVMFYLSNLVRYFPNKLYKADRKGDTWLLRRYVESSPLTMLRYMVYLILDKQVILERI
ncbi:TPA: hypothetical protein DEP90_01475 [Patescibacteria group bacterium]|nr:hypothetical protein [Patescibacteria group bacterium]